MNDEDFWNYARQRAQTIPEPSSHTEYVECKLGSSACLIALHGLAEALPPPHQLARLPDVPAWMVGLLAWRSETIAVVDLRHYLQDIQGGDTLLTTAGILLVANHGSLTLGLLVSSLGFTVTIGNEQIEMPPHNLPDFALGKRAKLIEGIYKDLPILNVAMLLAELVEQIETTAYHG